MKIFKELKKLGYIFYSATTIEELDDLPLNNAERISEQALVLRFFRENYPELDFGFAKIYNGTNNYHYHINLQWEFFEGTYEEAELECLRKLILIVKEKLNISDVIDSEISKLIKRKLDGETLSEKEFLQLHTWMMENDNDYSNSVDKQLKKDLKKFIPKGSKIK